MGQDETRSQEPHAGLTWIDGSPGSWAFGTVFPDMVSRKLEVAQLVLEVIFQRTVQMSQAMASLAAPQQQPLNILTMFTC